MKSLVFGLTLVIIPGFASNASCPGSQYASLVGCQAFDSLLTSSGSMPTSVDDSTNFAASLFTQPTTAPVVVPQETPVTSFSATSLPGYTSAPTVSIVSPNSSLANELFSEQVPLSTLVVPTQFLNLNPGVPGSSSSVNFVDPPNIGVPETGSIAMIGSGLIALSLVSTIVRRKRRLKG